MAMDGDSRVHARVPAGRAGGDGVAVVVLVAAAEVVDVAVALVDDDGSVVEVGATVVVVVVGPTVVVGVADVELTGSASARGESPSPWTARPSSSTSEPACDRDTGW